MEAKYNTIDNDYSSYRNDLWNTSGKSVSKIFRNGDNYLLTHFDGTTSLAEGQEEFASLVETHFRYELSFTEKSGQIVVRTKGLSTGDENMFYKLVPRLYMLRRVGEKEKDEKCIIL